MIKNLDMNLITLKSVGSLIDVEDKIVYPQMTNGLPDLDMGVELSECSDEWVLSLSVEDRLRCDFPQSGNTFHNSIKFSDEMEL